MNAGDFDECFSNPQTTQRPRHRNHRQGSTAIPHNKKIAHLEGYARKFG
jgi:hypothetical protein